MKRGLLVPLSLLLAVAWMTSAAVASTASATIAAQLAAEGDRLGANRALLDDALALYERSFALEPPSAERLLKRGKLRERAGDPQGAIADLTWALARPGVDAETVLAERCRVYRLGHDAQRARADCVRALRLNEDNVIANGELAELELAAKNPSSAWRYATRASEMDSQTTRYEAIRCRAAEQMDWAVGKATACARAELILPEDR